MLKKKKKKRRTEEVLKGKRGNMQIRTGGKNLAH